jgi:hypothetical protein
VDMAFCRIPARARTHKEAAAVVQPVDSGSKRGEGGKPACPPAQGHCSRKPDKKPPHLSSPWTSQLANRRARTKRPSGT